MSRGLICTAVVVVLLSACGGGDDGGEVEGFDEEAALEELREGWPGTPDDELQDELQLFREACTETDPGSTEAAFQHSLWAEAGGYPSVMVAGCPDLVAELMARYGD